MRPITDKMAFLKADIGLVVEAFLAWQTPLVAEHKNIFYKVSINDSLEKLFQSLCPLTTAERRRYLFIPTQSEWVTLVDNGHTGTDRTIPEVLSTVINTDCVFFTYDSQTEETILDIYGMIEANKIDLIRSIAVVKEDGWRFYQYGSPLPFEDLVSYKSRRIKDRFNRPILNHYLKELGIDAFNDAFYNSKDAIMLIKQGPQFKNTKELTIEEAQNFFTRV